jgi:hypothetical protein
MKYDKPTIKSFINNHIMENAGPVQTAYAQVMWVQTQPITYNQQVHTNQLADSTIVRLEQKV